MGGRGPELSGPALAEGRRGVTQTARAATPIERATSLLAFGLMGAVRRMPHRRALAVGERLGDMAHALGIRRAVAERNLELAFPERSASERAAILREHYRELGRVCVEYANLPELARSTPGEVVAEVRGEEHLDGARALGRGVVIVTGHVCNFELAGAWVARSRPLDFVVKPLSNPDMERWIRSRRRELGVGQIETGAGMRAVFAALKANRCVAFLADQDARRHGVFVPFFGRLASTPLGPAAIALRRGAPLVVAFARRLADLRLTIEMQSPLVVDHPEAPDAALRLTALHTARLEARIRERPSDWFWLHRRWKTPPP
jgi:KDO2-lipid IV(A) lauroyltransferase